MAIGFVHTAACFGLVHGRVTFRPVGSHVYSRVHSPADGLRSARPLWPVNPGEWAPRAAFEPARIRALVGKPLWGVPCRLQRVPPKRMRRDTFGFGLGVFLFIAVFDVTLPYIYHARVRCTHEREYIHINYITRVNGVLKLYHPGGGGRSDPLKSFSFQCYPIYASPPSTTPCAVVPF